MGHTCNKDLTVQLAASSLKNTSAGLRESDLIVAASEESIMVKGYHIDASEKFQKLSWSLMAAVVDKYGEKIS